MSAIPTRSDVPIPPQMQHLPKWHGFPIPHTTMIVDGIPDFRVVNEHVVKRCITHRLCGMCAEEIKTTEWVAFIGGEKSVQNRLFIDPGMHRDCAYYAAQVCPFLAGTKRVYAERESRAEKSDEVTRITKIDQTRPTRMALYLCKTYDIVQQGHVLLCQAAKKPRRLDWEIMPPSKPNDG